MIISHKHKFIFIKTRKTASTSIEAYLYDYLDKGDVAPKYRVDKYNSRFNPLTEGFCCLTNPILLSRSFMGSHKDFMNLMKLGKIATDFITKTKFQPHSPAILVKFRIPQKIWDSYFKFCVERNPFDKIVSHYHQPNNKRYSFEEYIEKGIWKSTVNYPLYTNIKQENIIMDRVIYYENLNSELREILNWLGIPFTTLNKWVHSKHRKDRRGYQEFWRDHLGDKVEQYVDKVANDFRKEMEWHGYEF